MPNLQVDDQELSLIKDAVITWLQDYDDDFHLMSNHDSPEEWVEFRRYYIHMLKFHWALLGTDFSCGHGQLTREGKLIE